MIKITGKEVDNMVSEFDMILTIHKAKELSKNGDVYWVMGDGFDIVYTPDILEKHKLVEQGYWVVAIFQYGLRAEA